MYTDHLKSYQIWDAYNDWTDKAKKTIGYQIIRSSGSIAANIAEGYGRFSPNDRKIFYRYAQGSFEETKSWLRKPIRRNLLSENQIQKCTEINNELDPKLNAFIKSTK